MTSAGRARVRTVARHWLGTAALVLLTTPAAPSQQWRPYTNSRFGTSADVPADFKVGPAPTNDDGRSFTSPDGRVTIRVFASYAPSTVTDGFEAYERWLEIRSDPTA